MDFSSTPGRVIKGTHPGNFGAIFGLRPAIDKNQNFVEVPALLQATPREYLDRMTLSNELFLETQLLGVARTASGLSIITSQRKVIGRPAEADEIAAAMRVAGFEKIHPQGIWERDSVLAWDLVGNSVVAEDRLYVFDALVMQGWSGLINLISNQQ